MSVPFAHLQHKKFISSNIPLPTSHVSRTESEVQLAMDVAAAERRDERMFHRLINGIQDRHQQIKKKAGVSAHSRVTETSRAGYIDNEYATDMDKHECTIPLIAIANIVGTHHSKIGEFTDNVLNTQGIQSKDDSDDEQSRSTPPTNFKTCTFKNLSDNNLSDNDWSITGYEFSETDNIVRGDFTNDGADEDIFSLDLE